MISTPAGLATPISAMAFVDFGIFTSRMGFRTIITSKLHCIGALELGCDLG